MKNLAFCHVIDSKIGEISPRVAISQLRSPLLTDDSSLGTLDRFS